MVGRFISLTVRDSVTAATTVTETAHYQLYINGQWREGATCAAPADVQDAVDAAKTALYDGEWAGLSATGRGKLLYRLAELIDQNAQVLGELETKDSGKLAVETVGQTRYVADYYRYFAGLADKIEGATLPIDKPDMHVFTTPVPIGVVAAIVPWNAQMFLTATKLGPALAAGCTVILKASEVSPCAMLEFARLVHEAGFPPGVVSIITGDADNCSIPLTSNKLIDRIAFTGGPDTARHVVRNSATNFAVTTLELGGKSPIIVFDDADLESAANGLIAGNFGASGQSCVAGSRAFVHSSIKDELIKIIQEKARHIVIGDPLQADTHVGPLCTLAQVDRIGTTLSSAVQQGANIVFGGKRPQGFDEGYYFEPTLVDCPDTTIETQTVEMFGPVMSIVSFDSEDDAIAMANDSEYGLGSGIFTNNLARAHRVSAKIRAGICWVNTYRVISPIAPFGGINQSGYGREAGMHSVLDYTRTKTTWVNTSDSPMANPFVMR